MGEALSLHPIYAVCIWTHYRMLRAFIYIYTLLYADMATCIYKRGGMCLHYLHVSACMLLFHFGIEAADASRHDKAEGPEPP